ncbi:hypothetical protein IWX63_001364 [Arthrobacter sp. CAN_A2]|uniref:hypothetical protein n=1 Tax=Arthrobacter sp. CAN_A2 TaxID=2787718 RepID=UPI0018EFA146
MKNRMIPAVIIAAFVATAGPLATANAASPTDAGSSGTLAGFCSFDVAFTVTGKTKTITKSPTERLITSPGQKVTLSANGKTVSYVVTGSRLEKDVTVGGRKITEVQVRGRNILLNAIGVTETPGLILVVGNFNYALDSAGNEVRGVNVNGPGQVTNVCQVLS